MSQGLIAVILGALGCTWYVGSALIGGSLPITPGWLDQRVPLRRADAPITFWTHVCIVAALAATLSVLAFNWPQPDSGAS